MSNNSIELLEESLATVIDKSQSTTNSTSLSASPKQNIWWIAMFFFLAITATGVAIYIGDLGLYQQFYIRIIIAISIAGIASIIPGFFDLQLKWMKNSIRAGGAIGIFVFIYMFNPATLDDSFRPGVNLTGTWNFYSVTKDEDVPIRTANIEHAEGRNIFNIIGNISTAHHAKHGIYNSPIITFKSDFALITHEKIIFHYLNNRDEEGIAIANYSESNVDELFFNFNDYSTRDNDKVPNGVLKFVLIKNE